MSLRDELYMLLEPHGQEHLLDGWDSLNISERQNLADQISALDLRQLGQLFADLSKPHIDSSSHDSITPMEFHMAADDSRRNYWVSTGEALLAQGQAAAFLVAGGQGSRLGYDGPKGVFDIGLPSHKSIFQLQAERLLRLTKLFGKPIPWCIMTSPLNHVDTVKHFEEHEYFGLEKDFIRFFPQAMIPAMNTQGKILRESAGSLALVPDGNGGCFRALSRSGSLDWLSSLGVRFVFLYGVDNILAKVCDPFFLGALACANDQKSASKVVPKRSADEKVGIFAYRDGKPGVIEYSDLPATLRDLRGPEGNLVFDGGNIATHLFRLDALRQLEHEPLPWHSAFKKVPYWTPESGMTQPSEANAWKFEQFLFDSFPILGSMLPFGVSRDDEFAPVKNATGDDSPASARKMLGTYHRRWLTRVDVPVQDGQLYEVSPLLSYAGEGLDPSLFQDEFGKGIRSFSE